MNEPKLTRRFSLPVALTLLMACAAVASLSARLDSETVSAQANPDR